MGARRARDQHRCRRATVTVVLLVALLLAGCTGGPGDPGDGQASPSPSPTQTPASTVTPAPTVTPDPTGATRAPPPEPSPAPSPDPPRAVQEALTGEVFAGVTAGCKLIATERGDYLLLGELAQDLRVGDTVTIRGEVRTDVGTICQQGTPLQVTEVLD